MSKTVAYQGKPKPRPNAYALFLLGKDTVQIAKLLGITEAQASRRVFVGRCKARKLAIGFEPKDQRRPGRPSRTKEWVKVGNPALGYFR